MSQFITSKHKHKKQYCLFIDNGKLIKPLILQKQIFVKTVLLEIVFVSEKILIVCLFDKSIILKTIVCC